MKKISAFKIGNRRPSKKNSSTKSVSIITNSTFKKMTTEEHNNIRVHVYDYLIP